MKVTISKGMERLIDNGNRSMSVLFMAGFTALEPENYEDEELVAAQLTVCGTCLNTKQSLYDTVLQYGDPQMLTRFWFTPLGLPNPVLLDTVEPHVQDLTTEGFFGHELDEDGVEQPTGRGEIEYIPWGGVIDVHPDDVDLLDVEPEYMDNLRQD